MEMRKGTQSKRLRLSTAPPSHAYRTCHSFGKAVARFHHQFATAATIEQFNTTDDYLKLKNPNLSHKQLARKRTRKLP